jgi:hypothetical protein
MIEAIGWLTVFVGGGFAFATLSAFVVLYLTSRPTGIRRGCNVPETSPVRWL